VHLAASQTVHKKKKKKACLFFFDVGGVTVTSHNLRLLKSHLKLASAYLGHNPTGPSGDPSLDQTTAIPDSNIKVNDEITKGRIERTA